MGKARGGQTRLSGGRTGSLVPTFLLVSSGRGMGDPLSVESQVRGGCATALQAMALHTHTQYMLFL